MQLRNQYLERDRNRNAPACAGTASRRDARERRPREVVAREAAPASPASNPKQAIHKKTPLCGALCGWRAWRDSNSRPLGS